MTAQIDFSKKISVYECAAWMKNYAEKVGVYDESTFNGLLGETKPVGFKAPRKKQVSKHSNDPEERSKEEYDRTRCDARVCLGTSGKRYGAQCSCSKIEGMFLCKRHQKEYDTNDNKLRNGLVTEERPTHAFNNTDDDKNIIFWHDAPQELLDRYPTKTKKARKCSLCGCEGHTKAKCPQAAKNQGGDVSNTSTASNNPVLTTEQLMEMCRQNGLVVAPVVEEAAEEAAENQVEEEVENQVEEVENVPEQAVVDAVDQVVECLEDLELSDEDTGAGTGLDLEEDNEEVPEEEEEFIEFEVDGVEYHRNKDGDVLDDDEDLVGHWVDDKVEFTREGLRSHKKILKAMK